MQSEPVHLPLLKRRQKALTSVHPIPWDLSVGSKVVCIDARLGACKEHPRLVRNHPYTVADVKFYETVGFAIGFTEHPKDDGTFWHWDVIRFRPVEAA